MRAATELVLLATAFFIAGAGGGLAYTAANYIEPLAYPSEFLLRISWQSIIIGALIATGIGWLAIRGLLPRAGDRPRWYQVSALAATLLALAAVVAFAGMATVNIGEPGPGECDTRPPGTYCI